LCRSLEAIEGELAAESCSIFAVNDSPEDTDLQAALLRAATHFRIPFEFTVNGRNLGFVASPTSASVAPWPAAMTPCCSIPAR
jgi:hypothetical protein